MGNNPYHNQHVKEITEAIDRTVFELQAYYDSLLQMMQQEIDEQKDVIDEQKDIISEKDRALDEKDIIIDELRNIILELENGNR